MGQTESCPVPKLTPEQDIRRKYLSNKFVDQTRLATNLITNGMYELKDAINHGTWKGYIIKYDIFVNSLHENSINLFKLSKELDEYTLLGSWDKHSNEIVKSLAHAMFICATYCEARENTIECAILHSGIDSFHIMQHVTLCTSVPYLDTTLMKLFHIMGGAENALNDHYFSYDTKDLHTIEKINETVQQLLCHLDSVLESLD